MTHDKFCPRMICDCQRKGLTRQYPDWKCQLHECICLTIQAIRQDQSEKVAQEIEAYCECPSEEALPECPCRYSYKLAAIARGDSK